MVLPKQPWWAAIAVAGMLIGPGRASAGWITITNDTPAVLIVQEVRDDDGPVRRPKTVRLLPGETYREFHPGEGKTTVQVFDARTPTKPVYRGSVKWATAEVGLTLEPDGTSVKLVRTPTTLPGAAATVVPVSVSSAPDKP